MSSYHTVAVSQTAQELAGAGQSGGKGDVIKCVIASVDTAGAGAAATVTDGSTEIPLVPASTPVGVHTIIFEEGLVAQTGPWKATTGANVTLIVIGDFGRE